MWEGSCRYSLLPELVNSIQKVCEFNSSAIEKELLLITGDYRGSRIEFKAKPTYQPDQPVLWTTEVKASLRCTARPCQKEK